MKRGQALIVVLLVLGVALTVGMSIISRSVTEVSVSTTQDESSEALSAAEAGIEKALGGVIPTPPNSTPVLTTPAPLGNGSFNVSTAQQAGGTDFVFPDTLEAGDVGTISLGAVGTSLTVCLGAAVPLEVIGYYRTSGGVVAANRVYVASPASGGSCPLTGSVWSTTIGTFSTTFFHTADTPLLLRIRPLGGPVVVAVRANWTLPSQGQTITSTGQSGAATQKIQVTKLAPDLPPMFDHALFSGSSLIQ